MVATMSIISYYKYQDVIIMITQQSSIRDKIDYAYNNKDATASKDYHLIKLDQSQQKHSVQKYETSQEHHRGDAGDSIKSIIFGALDGILTVFSMISSISGSNLDIVTILVLGFAKLVGGALSMGIGDFLSEKAEIDFIKSEMERERWEFDNFKEGEIKEMIDIYKEKGIDEEDAKIILTRMSKYPQFFLEHMMIQELELDPCMIEDNPLKSGAITALSFLFLGSIPLLSYLFYYISFNDKESDIHDQLITAIVITCSTLFIMGSVKGFVNPLSFVPTCIYSCIYMYIYRYYCNQNTFNTIKSGLFVMFNGMIAGGSAWAISLWLS